MPPAPSRRSSRYRPATRGCGPSVLPAGRPVTRPRDLHALERVADARAPLAGMLVELARGGPARAELLAAARREAALELDAARWSELEAVELADEDLAALLAQVGGELLDRLEATRDGAGAGS